jgi:hypothetical protein
MRTATRIEKKQKTNSTTEGLRLSVYQRLVKSLRDPFFWLGRVEIFVIPNTLEERVLRLEQRLTIEEKSKPSRQTKVKLHQNLKKEEKA